MKIEDFEIVNLFKYLFKQYDIKIYLVGGAVRDMLLNIQPMDFDFAAQVSEDDHKIISVEISKKLGCKMDYNDYYHTAKFSYNNKDIDFVMCRKESYNSIASKPIIKPASIFDDLRRRDFTLNAIAIPLFDDFTIIDPLNGREDIKKEKIKILHKNSFKDDPTRIFRGIKYASRFDFEFEEFTEKLIEDAVYKGYINYIKPERIKSELELLFNEDGIINSIFYLNKYKIIDSIIDEELNINNKFNLDEFKTTSYNNKFCALFFDNNEKVLKKLAESLSLGEDFIRGDRKIKCIQKELLKDDESIYYYFLKNNSQNLVSVLKLLFYNDRRVKSFLQWKDKLIVDKNKIENIEPSQRRETLAKEKLALLEEKIDGGI